MPGNRQRRSLFLAFEKGYVPTPTGRFRPVSEGSNKIECVLCGLAGYGKVDPTAQEALPWQLAHMMPHLYPCSCGMRFAAPWHLAIHIEPARWIPQHEERGEHHWAVNG